MIRCSVNDSVQVEQLTLEARLAVLDRAQLQALVQALAARQPNLAAVIDTRSTSSVLRRCPLHRLNHRRPAAGARQLRPWRRFVAGCEVPCAHLTACVPPRRIGVSAGWARASDSLPSKRAPRVARSGKPGVLQ